MFVESLARSWWLFVVRGLLAVSFGILAFEIAAAIALRKEIENEWLLALGGLASVLFGVVLMVRPGAGALAVLWLIGAYAIAFGVLPILLGFGLHRRPARAVAGV